MKLKQVKLLVSTDYKSLQQVLQAIIEEQKLNDELQRSDLMEKFNEIVGEQIARQVKLKNFEKGILKIEVESSVWKNEIFLLREKIIEKLNKAFGKQVVKQILIL